MKITDILFEKTKIKESEFEKFQNFYNLKENDYLSKKERDGSTSYSLNFVGFIVNSDDDVLISLPLNYKLDSNNMQEVTDASINVMKTINKHTTTSKEFYISKEGNKTVKASYPFTAFFEIYNYYSKYGLHFSYNQVTSIKPTKKINWKKTIKETNFYVSNGNLVFYPFYYDQNYKTDTFLTMCMINAINSTIKKFGLLIGLSDTGVPTPEYNFDSNYVVPKLREIQESVFDDIENSLISNLIDFYNEKDISKNEFYYKHFAYYDVWEKMVHHYLDNNFDSIDNTHNVIYKTHPSSKGFEKNKSFYPNQSKTGQYIEIDFYLAEDETQYIFDAKYKEIDTVDYKQLAYYFLLKEYIPDNIWDGIKGKDKQSNYYSKTYAAMFSPYENWASSIIHFSPKLQFSRENKEMFIIEERMSIKDVIDYWLK